LTRDRKEVLVCAGDSDRIDVMHADMMSVVRSFDSGADLAIVPVEQSANNGLDRS
jgi:hypothetical protein